MCANVTTVSDGLASEYHKEFGIDVGVIRNIPYYPSTPTPWSGGDEVLRLVHTGLAAKSRKLENLISAVRDVSTVNLDIYLREAPHQKRYLRSLIRMANKT